MEKRNSTLILIVDENDVRRCDLVNIFRLSGHKVFTESDNESARATIARQRPDLIIASAGTDDQKVDGYELAKSIHAEMETRFVPVIIRPETLGGTQEDIRRDAESDALTFALNSTSLDLLLARVRTLLEFKAHLDACTEAAFTDPLTGLANRRRFNQQLDEEIARTQRYARPFCLFILDIDHFKKVNDTYGHAAGDHALKHVAQILMESARSNDLVARIGGEEFAVILPETMIEKGVQVANRIRAQIAQSEIPGVGQVTISIGVSEFPLCACTPDTLMSVTDAALYEAKRAGRNLVMLADERRLRQVA